MRQLLTVVTPFLTVFFGALVLTLVLTPLVREINRRLGMVDNPDPRRINKVPIPRGGGAALFLGLFVSYGLYVLLTGSRWLDVGRDIHPLRMIALATVIFLLGLADDKFGLNAKLKLAGQVVVAVLVWAWVGLGFSALWPSLPPAIDCLLTVFWVVGAVNAFNLIDGLDGLASGIAFIAVLGMAGSLLFDKMPTSPLFHFAFAGALLGFLFHNYHPATVFLGDSGSMLIGFLVATLPLAYQTPHSFLVSVGVPFLAMGVPIFDTSLAILRRLIRRLLVRRDGGVVAAGDSDAVMTADHDHLHHRLLRSSGFSQRRAAWVLYLMTLAAVLFGIIGMALESKSAGVWLVAIAVAAFVIFRDMAAVELFDAGRLLARMAHERGWSIRRQRARMSLPFFVVCDVGLLVAAYFVTVWSLHVPVERSLLRVNFPIRILISFAAVVAMRTYVTNWGRASGANFVRLLAACAGGSAVGGVIVYYLPNVRTVGFLPGILMYFSFSFIFLAMVRMIRPFVRDLFFTLACSRLQGQAEVSRTLVYGAGLRYRAFIGELIRRTMENRRLLVGLLDDDVLLRGKYVGSLKVLGTLFEAPQLIQEHRVDAVVIACEVTPEWLKVIKRTLAPTGVKITHFDFSEKEI